jgi:hypothetical protein
MHNGTIKIKLLDFIFATVPERSSFKPQLFAPAGKEPNHSHNEAPMSAKRAFLQIKNPRSFAFGVAIGASIGLREVREFSSVIDPHKGGQSWNISNRKL